MSRLKHEISRRQLLGAGAALPLVAAPAMAAFGQNAEATAGAPPQQTEPDYTLNLAQKSIAPLGTPVDATLVNGTLPGPTIRYREGDMFRVLVQNRLPVPTTVHWHGMLAPCYMDGVPGITQLPIGPNESVLYEYPLRQSGTYWYHSHYQFQEQTGLSGPLIIEARNEPHAYDHDVVVFLSDWLNQSPYGLVPQMRKQRPATAAVEPPKTGGYPFPGDRPFNIDVNYPGYLMNGRSNDDPWTLKVRRGDRIRLRIINGSTATFFRVALAGHDLNIIAADGQSVESHEVSNLVMATAERYDALVTVKESGSFTLHAAALGSTRQAIGVVHTDDVAAKADTARPTFRGAVGGAGDYAALRSPYPTTLREGPVQTFDIQLGGVMMKYLWSINGEYYPEMYSPDGKATPLLIRSGSRVRFRFTNATMMYHPMHLHGHFYRLLRTPGDWDDAYAPLKDTFAIGPKQKIDIEFFADNPGRWFFHCHNLYHLSSGMAREVRYEA